MSAERQLVKVVPGRSVDGMPQPTRGTQVLMPSGEAIRGVTRITLTADVNDVWRAQIECLASLDEITALADVTRRYVGVSDSIPYRTLFTALWARFKVSMRGRIR